MLRVKDFIHTVSLHSHPCTLSLSYKEARITGLNYQDDLIALGGIKLPVLIKIPCL